MSDGRLDIESHGNIDVLADRILQQLLMQDILAQFQALTKTPDTLVTERVHVWFHWFSFLLGWVLATVLSIVLRLVL